MQVSENTNDDFLFIDDSDEDEIFDSAIRDTWKVLIVDDDTQFSGYLAELLPSFDSRIKVQVANDGFEAGKLVHILKPDMILMDLMMPTMDGFETCRSIKNDPATSKTRIICMTGYGSQDNIQRIISLGAEACITKPVDEDELEKYIQLLLV